MSKIMIISLDGASWSALTPFVRDGIMPNLGKIINKGSHGNLHSVIPPVTAPAWSSFMTGKHPDKHSVFEFRCFDIERRIDYMTNSSYIQSETIWQILSRHGRKVISINVPYTYPVYDVNGILISGIDTPSKDSIYCSPFSIKEIIDKKFPDYVPVMESWDMKKISNESSALSYIRKLERSIDLKIKLSLYLLSEYRWDVSMIHFQETDYIQHMLWDKVIEAAYGKGVQPIHKAIKDFFSKIDNSIGRLCNIVDMKETNIIIISDHGFTDHKGLIFPNVALEKAGLLAKEEGTVLDSLKRNVRNSDNPFVKLGYSLQKRIRNALRVSHSVTTYEKLRLKNIYDTIPVAWDKSRALMVMGSQDAFVYLKDENCFEVCKDVLKNMRNTETNEPLFKSILSLNEAYDRAEKVKENMIIAIPYDGYSVSRVIKDIEFTKDGFFPGIHQSEGIFVAYGNNIKGDFKHDLKLIDVVPICLYLLGIPVPSDMDGRVVQAIFKKTSEILTEELADKYSREEQNYDEESEEMIKERLRSLGYLE